MIRPFKTLVAYAAGTPGFKGVHKATISGNLSITKEMAQRYVINGGAGDRNITMFVPTGDMVGAPWAFYNSGTTNNLVIKDAAASTITTLLPAQYCEIVWSLNTDGSNAVGWVLDRKGGAGLGGTDFGAPGLKTDLITESTAGSGVTIDESTATTGSAAIKLADNLASALVIKEGSTNYQTFVTTNSGEQVKIHKNLKVDNVGGLTGTTGTFGIALTDNLADALSISEGANPFVTFVTTDSSEAVNVKKRLTNTDGVASGVAKVVGGRAYSQTAASTAITGTTETSTIFDTNVSLPANTLKAGSIVRFSAWGKVTAQTGGETHTLAYQVGSVVVGVTGNIDPGTSDYFHLMGELAVRTAGASGTCVGWVRISSGASAASGTPLMYFLDSSVLDTTGANICGVYLDRQGSATDSDSMRLDHHFVEVT